jgi:carbon storage regulator
MLILSRKPNESIVIDGRITVKIIRLEGEAVKIGIQAPADVPVHRQEVYEEIQRNNQEAALSPRPLSLKLPVPRAAQREQSHRAPVVAPPAAINQNQHTANT